MQALPVVAVDSLPISSFSLSLFNFSVRIGDRVFVRPPLNMATVAVVVVVGWLPATTTHTHMPMDSIWRESLVHSLH